jgi:integrating conjugative element protein (TIGR03752 family)
MTFIFRDGTISMTQAKGADASLGYLSSQTGNPCMPGTLHSNAGLFLGAQMALAGASGYIHTLTQAVSSSANKLGGATLPLLLGNANKAAFNQGGSAAAEAARTWWNRRVQNSFDYVYLPNINAHTGKPMTVVVNITQQISINHNATARKVSYDHDLQTNHAMLD